jgi:hypothetical protein
MQTHRHARRLGERGKERLLVETELARKWTQLLKRPSITAPGARRVLQDLGARGECTCDLSHGMISRDAR